VAIEVLNKQRLVPIEARKVAEVASATLALAPAPVPVRPAKTNSPATSSATSPNGSLRDSQLTVVFVRDKKIRELNRSYRGKDYATDVLSFQARDAQDEAFDWGEDDYLGDIVISTDTAMRQAQEAAQTVEREVQELVIHGVLHLCGYDHETDNGEMNRLELRLRKKLLD
jgi:probable rRNA maturation factor